MMIEYYILTTHEGGKPAIMCASNGFAYPSAEIRDANAFSLHWRRRATTHSLHRLDVTNGHLVKVADFPERFFEGVYMVKGQFQIDDGPIFEGYHVLGQCWNGWEMPYFTREVAEQILTAYPDDIPDPEDDEYTGYYNYSFPMDDAKIIIDPDNTSQTLTLWGIGAGGWVWDEVIPDEKGEDGE